MKDEKKAPKLRFKVFTDDWEQCKLGDVANRFDNLRVPVTANLRKNGNTPYYGANGIQDFVDGYTHDGEYILVAEDGANNLKNYPINYVSGRIWVNNHAHVLQAIPDLANTRFLGYEIGRSNIVSLLVGGGRAKLNADALMNMSINLPKMQEQELIAKIFKTIDHAITLHEEKKRQLERFKSALLQKMFADKSGYPVVRFKGFSVEWVQRKLGKITDVRDGTHSSPHYVNNGYPLLTSKNVNNGRINYDGVNYISKYDYTQINKRSKVDVNDILMGMIGTIGNLAIIQEKPNFAIKNVALIKHTGSIDSQFLFHNLQTDHITNELSSSMDGGTQRFVSLKQIRNLLIVLPMLDEQAYIGTTFQIVDAIITLHNQKLRLLRRIKQSLLQKMFI